MGDPLIALAHRRGQAWAERMLLELSRDVAWPEDTKILSRLAWLEVRDLSSSTAEQERLAESWIIAAESRWQAARDSRVSGQFAAIA